MSIVTIFEYRYRAALGNVCREWKNLGKRYIVGRPSLLPIEWLKNRSDYALSLGGIPPEDAVRIIFEGHESLALYGTLPKWLVPTVVEV